MSNAPAAPVTLLVLPAVLLSVRKGLSLVSTVGPPPAPPPCLLPPAPPEPPPPDPDQAKGLSGESLHSHRSSGMTRGQSLPFGPALAKLTGPPKFPDAAACAALRASLGLGGTP